MTKEPFIHAMRNDAGEIVGWQVYVNRKDVHVDETFLVWTYCLSRWNT